MQLYTRTAELLQAHGAWSEAAAGKYLRLRTPESALCFNKAGNYARKARDLKKVADGLPDDAGLLYSRQKFLAENGDLRRVSRKYVHMQQ